MPLDNLFAVLGGPGTALLLLGIVVFVGVAPVLAVVRGAGLAPVARRLSRGR
jgi:hypothetical protein